MAVVTYNPRWGTEVQGMRLLPPNKNGEPRKPPSPARRDDFERFLSISETGPDGFVGPVFSDMFVYSRLDPYKDQSFLKEYFKTELWAHITEMVMERQESACQVCGEAASVVHLLNYSIQTLRGRTIEHMAALCQKHKDEIDFDGESKSNLSQANKKLRQSAKTYGWKHWGDFGLTY